MNKLLDDTFPDMKGKFDFEAMANMIVGQLGSVGCKTALRLVERAVTNPHGADALDALASILEDLAGDEVTAERLCEVI